MNDEIANRMLCKAKSLKDDEWVRGNYYKRLVTLPQSDTLCIYHYIQKNKENTYPTLINYDTLCRCTGKRDKENNLIFEYDILLNIFDLYDQEVGKSEIIEITWTVFWHKSKLCWYVDSLFGGDYYENTEWPLNSFSKNQITIINNAI